MSYPSSPMSAPRAVVIGGSLAGLFAGSMLRRAGWQVQIYERVARDLAGRGAGIVTHQPLCDVLDAIGIAWRDHLGIDVAQRRILDLDGRVTLEYACRQTMTAWDRLYALLHAAFPEEHYHRGMELVRFDQDSESVIATFADGTQARGDVLLGCDGLRSAVRASLLPEVQPLYAGYVGWRSLVAENAFPPDLHRELFDHFSFSLPTGEQMLGYPVAGPDNDLRVGHRRYNLVWYRPADDAALTRLLTDDSGRTHQISIPPPAVSESAIRELYVAAERVLAPQFRACWRLAERPFVQPIYDVQSPRLAFGRVALLGDAAFVARPHCGVGVTKAAQDAAALTRSLSTERNAMDGLQRYEAERLPFGQRVVAQARRLGSYLQAQIRTPEERRAAAHHFSPESVLRDTATLDFLADAG
jgi:2-polyprenyl-6-methoxyphenol hydroxylase-like FAD-dependent oxidoreductase